MKALIDGDILVYRIGYSTEDVPERLAGVRLRDYFNEILESLLVSDYETHITSSDKSNYRYALDPTYKANRTQPKPVHYDYLRDRLTNDPHYQGIVSFGREADDSIGIASSRFASKRDFIIVSIDKDLKQIPGWHYDFVKKRKFYVSQSEASKFIYRQLLTGDSADNIGGITGIGDSISDKLLEPCTNVSEFYRVVRHIYSEVDDVERLIKRGQLLKIQQRENEPLWQPPELSDEEKQQGVSHLIKVDWRKSFERYSKRREKKLSSMNQSASTSSTQPSSDSTCQIG